MSLHFLWKEWKHLKHIAYHIVKNQEIKINRQNVENNMKDVHKD